MIRQSRRTARSAERRTPSGRANPRTLAQYRAEVVALLRVRTPEGRAVPTEMGVRLLGRYDAFVRVSWQTGKPPCYVADKLRLKVTSGEHEAIRATGKAKRDMQYGRDRRRRVVKKGRGRRTGRDIAHSSGHRIASFTSRDPARGEIYETKTGVRWQVVDLIQKKGKRGKERTLGIVKKYDIKDIGPLPWGVSVFKSMKLVDVKAIRKKGGEPAQARRGLAEKQTIAEWISQEMSGDPPKAVPLDRGSGIELKERDPDDAHVRARAGSRYAHMRDGDGPARRYHVYVIETAHQGRSILYVGSSWHKPEARLLQHKKGAAYCKGCKARSYARGTKHRLRKDLVTKFVRNNSFRTRGEALKVETQLAKVLRAKTRLIVRGGH